MFKKMTKQTTDLFETIGDIVNPYRKPYKRQSHNSIMLPKFLSVIDEFGNRRKVKFLTEGQRVLLNTSGELQDLWDNTPTHQITHCWSIDYDTFGLTVIDLKTQELSKINL